jgi:hypothetical protein
MQRALASGVAAPDKEPRPAFTPRRASLAPTAHLSCTGSAHIDPTKGLLASRKRTSPVLAKTGTGASTSAQATGRRRPCRSERRTATLLRRPPWLALPVPDISVHAATSSRRGCLAAVALVPSRSAVATPCVAKALLRTGFGQGAKRRHCGGAPSAGSRVKAIVPAAASGRPRPASWRRSSAAARLLRAESGHVSERDESS